MNIQGALNVSNIVDIARQYINYIDDSGIVEWVKDEWSDGSSANDIVQIHSLVKTKDDAVLRCKDVVIRTSNNGRVLVHGSYTGDRSHGGYFCVSFHGLKNDDDILSVEEYFNEKNGVSHTKKFYSELDDIISQMTGCMIKDGVKPITILGTHVDDRDGWISVSFTAAQDITNEVVNPKMIDNSGEISVKLDIFGITCCIVRLTEHDKIHNGLKVRGLFIRVGGLITIIDWVTILKKINEELSKLKE